MATMSIKLPTISKDFPVSFAAAQKLYQVISEKPTDSPFSLRRNVVKLFKAFDEQLKDWELPALHNTEFTTVTSVLSERQLGLKSSNYLKFTTRILLKLKAIPKDTLALTGLTTRIRLFWRIQREIKTILNFSKRFMIKRFASCLKT